MSELSAAKECIAAKVKVAATALGEGEYPERFRRETLLAVSVQEEVTVNFYAYACLRSSAETVDKLCI